MALTLNGSTGVSGVNGSSSAPSVVGSDSNTGFSFASDTVVINTGGSERCRVNSSGSLLIGTTTTSGTSSQGDDIIIGAIGDSTARGLTFATTGAASIRWADAGDNAMGRIQYDNSSDVMTLHTSNAERMRLTSDGKVFIGHNNRNGVDATTSTLAVTGNTSTNTGNVPGSFFGGAVTSQRFVLAFSNNNGVVGSISTNGTQTQFNAASDYRLKENVVSISDGITRLKKLKPSRFNFITDKTKTLDGFLAHEVSEAVPEAVAGEKDGMDGETYYEEGDTLPTGKEYGDVKTYSTTKIHIQGLDLSKLVPLLTAALQEAVGKIETLETKVAALEAA